MKTSWLLLRLLYWHRYARALERQLEGERWRNQSREDELLTVPMRMLGMYGVATREGLAQPREPLRRQVERPLSRTNVRIVLTDDERAEWAIYKADTDASGVPERQARREFEEMIEYRRAGNDAEIM